MTTNKRLAAILSAVMVLTALLIVPGAMTASAAEIKTLVWEQDFDNVTDLADAGITWDSKFNGELVTNGTDKAFRVTVADSNNGYAALFRVSQQLQAGTTYLVRFEMTQDAAASAGNLQLKSSGDDWFRVNSSTSTAYEVSTSSSMTFDDISVTGTLGGVQTIEFYVTQAATDNFRVMPIAGLSEVDITFDNMAIYAVEEVPDQSEALVFEENFDDVTALADAGITWASSKFNGELVTNGTDKAFHVTVADSDNGYAALFQIEHALQSGTTYRIRFDMTQNADASAGTLQLKSSNSTWFRINSDTSSVITDSNQMSGMNASDISVTGTLGGVQTVEFYLTQGTGDNLKLRVMPMAGLSEVDITFDNIQIYAMTDSLSSQGASYRQLEDQDGDLRFLSRAYRQLDSLALQEVGHYIIKEDTLEGLLGGADITDGSALTEEQLAVLIANARKVESEKLVARTDDYIEFGLRINGAGGTNYRSTDYLYVSYAVYGDSTAYNTNILYSDVCIRSYEQVYNDVNNIA